MLQAVDYSVYIRHDQEPEQAEGYKEYAGVHEGANGQNHNVLVRVSNANAADQEFIESCIESAIENDDLDMLLMGVTGLACPEIGATRIKVPESKKGDDIIPESEEVCTQINTLIINAQTIRQKNPAEPVSSSVIVVGEGIINDYIDKRNANPSVPKNYMVCEDLHLCIAPASEQNESVDPIKVKPAEGLPVTQFFKPATEVDGPSAFPSGYVSLTGFLEFGEGGFHNSKKEPVAFSRLRIIATDVVPLGISPNRRSEGKRQTQMLQQKKRPMRFSASESEDAAPKAKRSLTSLKV